VTAYPARPLRGARSARPDRAERPTPRGGRPAAPRDALFDAPSVPSETAGSAAPMPARPAAKRPVAALFRSPAKPETAG
jgi:ATP-dependent RNA helicase RhlE